MAGLVRAAAGKGLAALSARAPSCSHACSSSAHGRGASVVAKVSASGGERHGAERDGRRPREGRVATFPWANLSLNANGVELDRAEGGAGPSSSGQLFSCELQQDLFHVNSGKAIDTLREELPHVLERDLTMDIYTDEVALVDDISPKLARRANTSVGKPGYQRALWAVRFHSWLFFSGSEFQVLKIWQPSEDVIAVRWSFRGMPRIWGSARPGATTFVDGISEYKLNRQGLIYEHRVDNLDHNGLVNLQPALQDLAQLLSLSGGRDVWPTPSMFLGAEEQCGGVC